MAGERNIDPGSPLFEVGDERQVKIVQSKDGWHWKKGNQKRSEPYETEYAATQAARRELGHHPRRNYRRA